MQKTKIGSILLMGLVLVVPLTGCNSLTTGILGSQLSKQAEIAPPSRDALELGLSNREESAGAAEIAMVPGATALDPDNTSITFVGSAGPMKQSGSFEAFSGFIKLPTDPSEPGAMGMEIDMKSIKTKIGLLTKHLKSKDFFEVEKYPTASLSSATVQPTSEPNQYLISGELTIHGVTQNIEVPAQISITDQQIELETEFVLRQTDFGMDRGAKKAKDEVPVTLKASFPLQPSEIQQ